MTLGSMAEGINIYDNTLAKVNELRVKGSNAASKDSFSITDFIYSEKYLRVFLIL
jgi:hypothetical protein